MATRLPDGSIQMADGRVMYANSVILAADLIELLPVLTPPPAWPFISGGGGGAGGGASFIGPSTSGTPGPRGALGPQGFQGENGAFGGPQGAQGTQGNQGNDGIQGFQGTGIQGFQGSLGSQGNQGNIGTQGLQGFQGLGIQGPQGTNPGVQGPQGLQGFQGSGAQGFQGFQGSGGLLGFQAQDVGTLSISAGSGLTDLPLSVISFVLPAATLVEFDVSIFSNVMSMGQPDSSMSGRVILNDVTNAVSYDMVQEAMSGNASGAPNWVGVNDQGVRGRRLLTLAAGSYTFKLQTIIDSGTGLTTFNFTYPLVFTAKNYGPP